MKERISRRACLGWLAAALAMSRMGSVRAGGYAPQLDGMQGYAFDPKVRPSFGFLTHLTLDRKPLPADHTISYSLADGPGTSNKKTSVVGVLERVQWNLGETDPLLIAATVSAGTKQSVLDQKFNAQKPPAVRFGLVVFAWDAQAQRYYTAFAGEPPLEGRIRSDFNKLALSVSEDPSSTLSVPERYLLEFEVVPAAKAQPLLLAGSVSDRSRRNWGRAK